MKGPGSGRSRRWRQSVGFSLVEVPVALVVLEVGLLGCAGTLVLAHRHLAAAERMLGATQAASTVVDSLLAEGVSGSGEAVSSWGTLRWSPTEDGVLVRAEEPSGVVLVDWWIPLPGGT